MHKKNNFQDLAGKVIESAYKWAKEDSLKDGENAFTDNYYKLVENFNTFAQMKCGSPHDFVFIPEETLRNRYDEVFYILGEVNRKGLLIDQLRELNLALLAIANEIPGLENNEDEDDINENNDDEIKLLALVIRPVLIWHLPPVTATHLLCPESDSKDEVSRIHFCVSTMFLPLLKVLLSLGANVLHVDFAGRKHSYGRAGRNIRNSLQRVCEQENIHRAYKSCRNMSNSDIERDADLHPNCSDVLTMLVLLQANGPICHLPSGHYWHRDSWLFGHHGQFAISCSPDVTMAANVLLDSAEDDAPGCECSTSVGISLPTRHIHAVMALVCPSTTADPETFYRHPIHIPHVPRFTSVGFKAGSTAIFCRCCSATGNDAPCKRFAGRRLTRNGLNSLGAFLGVTGASIIFLIQKNTA